ncbi:MAG: heat-inducible transcription repressor HrcA [Pseudomonadales bacterium]|jgi:heat-inducible transcriptional repressor|uniref:heat-inducible transcriptional repressor HrcA n=1 Tax=unclassified Ketobacter TaxID=2639109 RepID=UPI000C5345F2|nr:MULTISPECIES: heat-inducible transcriptional repressor HrcA [unclassified Ketobacter]MAQ26604.1 heat-inducible transcription repressor HrcA [Pseudomonadales bacterium]MEC8811903.1 heat-inducible transcriptional repressor HrcA [Pseudomonadota bacterium]HAG93057.1 heat-inducible transcription repressor HrcA [Gammaproteobacteria bacterium]MBI26337.1 heat-inducible transcription repressor HrcA [Pseudomonadales bacterium]MCK5789410.1 heat-inducible transcription repressor HrcA [Ketobacter sp.]|tara:strand:+ start:374 stop:1405 length:1032 start_codon:yes stop_codon:yes gene_type:complete
MRPKVDRAEEVLKALVERYIRDGEPVGSKAIAQSMVNSASPATIRNVMAQLEERGLIHSPHTSAGRVPTSLGYRMFVDTMLTVSSPGRENVDQVKQRLLPDKTPQALMEEASEVLSDLTSMAGIVMVPKSDRSSLRQVEFLPLEGKRVLVILVLNDREVQNRIITTNRRYNESELQQAANYLNQHFIGNPLGAIRDRLLAAMRDDKVRMDSLMQTVIEVAGQSFQPSGQPECVVSGQSNLLAMADEQGVDRLRELFDAFQRKRDLLDLMDHCVSADGIQIYIGQESGYEMLDECSLISSPYGTEDEVLGVLAVIGPTRMPYQKVIPMVDLTAKILSAALKPAS